jgi:transcriptional regulator with XRE-family HTH domain
MNQGQMLQTAREKWRFSQRELSTRLGPIIQKFGPISRRESYPSRSAISNIERGKEELAADDIRLKALLEILCLDEAAFAQGNIVYTARPPAIPISPASQKSRHRNRYGSPAAIARKIREHLTRSG